MTDLSSDIDTSLSPWSDIYHAGFYPELVISALYDQLDSREILASLVHVETHVDYNDLHRHLTVLALTDTALATVHLTDFVAEEYAGATRAQVTTEMVPLDALDSVSVTTVHDQPATWTPDLPVAEVTLSLLWRGNQRLELVPAVCPDPDCSADHGVTGTSTPEDLALRVAAEAEGQQAVDQALAFARTLRTTFLTARDQHR
ncbi:DUF5998 family protein [Auritidibacter ignavus]|uniref:DUF5998 family protein n=1 Tax=Auritidibacter ignavus TaxID=678932 RepID=UPI0024469842|nr:DUF5998 family protein [Auritidibacter ignavus]WGH84566.1 DUF5998 family protein [Auritidibacter ignavus]